MNNIVIKADDLNDGKVFQLLEAHLAEMHRYSPPESIHALDRNALRHSSIAVLGAWENNELVGCGAIKMLSLTSAEIKSMRTHTDYVRRGIANQILCALLDIACERRCQQVFLETGTYEAFLPAIALYKKHGFEECEPFGDYQIDPYSVFYSKTL